METKTIHYVLDAETGYFKAVLSQPLSVPVIPATKPIEDTK